MAAGHGGVSGRYDSWKERAFELAWLLDVLGLAEVTPAAAAGGRPAAGWLAGGAARDRDPTFAPATLHAANSP